jgi:hypothetical protein
MTRAGLTDPGRRRLPRHPSTADAFASAAGIGGSSQPARYVPDATLNVFALSSLGYAAVRLDRVLHPGKPPTATGHHSQPTGRAP